MCSVRCRTRHAFTMYAAISVYRRLELIPCAKTMPAWQQCTTRMYANSRLAIYGGAIQTAANQSNIAHCHITRAVQPKPSDRWVHSRRHWLHSCLVICPAPNGAKGVHNRINVPAHIDHKSLDCFIIILHSAYRMQWLYDAAPITQSIVTDKLDTRRGQIGAFSVIDYG